MSLLDLIKDQLTGDRLKDLGRMVGANEGTVKTAVQAALPLLIGALAKNAHKPGGAEALHRAVEKDHDGSVLDSLGDFLKAPDTRTGDGILRHVLGARRQSVEGQLSRSTGIDKDGATRLLSTLAPVVMGALGKKQRQDGLDVGALSDMLRGDFRRAAEQESEETSEGKGLSGLMALLDADDDGDVKDDLAKVGGGLLGGLLKRKSK